MADDAEEGGWIHRRSHHGRIESTLLEDDRQ